MTLASPKFRRPRKPYRPRKTAPRYLLSCACSLLGNSVASVVLPLVLLATTGDALAAIKKYVFEEGKVTLGQICDALAANFEGYEDLQRLLELLSAIPAEGGTSE